MMFPRAYFPYENSSYLNICNKSAENLPSFQLDREDCSYLVLPPHSLPPPPYPPPSSLLYQTEGCRRMEEEEWRRKEDIVEEGWRRRQEGGWRRIEEEISRNKVRGREEEGRRREGGMNEEGKTEEEGFSPATMAEDSFFEDLPEEEIFMEKTAFWVFDAEDLGLLSEICVILDFNSFLDGLKLGGWKLGAKRMREVGIVKKVGGKKKEIGECILGAGGGGLDGGIKNETRGGKEGGTGLIKGKKKEGGREKEGGKGKDAEVGTIKRGKKKRKLD